MNAHCFDNFGMSATGGDAASFAGFSWYYCDPRDLRNEGRRLYLQVTCAQRVSQPVPAIVDCFGNVVIPLSAPF